MKQCNNVKYSTHALAHAVAVVHVEDFVLLYLKQYIVYL